MSVSAALKDAYALGLGADHIINNWGFDENLPKLGGPAAEGAMGLIACALFNDEYPAKKKVHEYAKKLNPGIAPRKPAYPDDSGLGQGHLGGGSHEKSG